MQSLYEEHSMHPLRGLAQLVVVGVRQDLCLNFPGISMGSVIFCPKRVVGQAKRSVCPRDTDDESESVNTVQLEAHCSQLSDFRRPCRMIMLNLLG
jgi:hypothetical protein